MAVRDTFSYTARWDSVGLDCSHCTHFRGPESWPDTERRSKCEMHGLSLEIELGADGYKEGEWFCLNFALGDSEQASGAAVRHLVSIRGELAPQVLYRLHGADGLLKEYPFTSLRRST